MSSENLETAAFSQGQEFEYRHPQYYWKLDKAVGDWINTFPESGAGLKAAICIDGPSAAGKREFGRDYVRSHPGVAVIDGDLFMRDRRVRPLPECTAELAQISPHSIDVKKWHDLERQRNWLEGLVRAKKGNQNNYVFPGAYRHDSKGTADHELNMDLGFTTLMLTGRYSLTEEVQSVFASEGIPVLRVIMDALPSERFGRVLERVSNWKSRLPRQQELVQTQIVEPDWLDYFPQIFPTTDYYVTTNGGLKIRTPRQTVQSGHVWGSYSDLVQSESELNRIIEIGAGGRTSIHRHAGLREIYYVVGGVLKVQIGSEPGMLQTQILHRGDGIMIQPGEWHSAGSFDGSQPLYYETVVNVSTEDMFSDIEKADPAIPRQGELSVLNF